MVLYLGGLKSFERFESSSWRPASCCYQCWAAYLSSVSLWLSGTGSSSRLHPFSAAQVWNSLWFSSLLLEITALPPSAVATGAGPTFQAELGGDVDFSVLTGVFNGGMWREGGVNWEPTEAERGKGREREGCVEEESGSEERGAVSWSHLSAAVMSERALLH